MEEIKVPKDQRILKTYTKPEIWAKFTGVFVAGILSLFGYQKMPLINESTKISEAVQVVKNLPPEELSALQGMQISSLEKQVKYNSDVQVAAINDLKNEMKAILKDYDDRTTKRLDKHGELILNNIKSIARLEALVPKARASQ